MNVKQIEAYLDDEAMLEAFLDEYMDTFDRIEVIENRLRTGALTLEEKASTLEELSAIYSSLNPVVELIEAYKTNLENHYFHNTRIQLEKDGKKPTVGFLEKEASAHVAAYRRMRSVFMGKR